MLESILKYKKVYLISFLSAKCKDIFQLLLRENVATIKILIFNNFL